MGTQPEPSPPAPTLRRSRRTARPLPRRAAIGRRSFRSTDRALEELAAAGAQVAVHVADLDSGEVVLTGDDHVSLPIAGLGVVPLLVEVAALIDAGRLDPLELVDRDDGVAASGTWRHLRTPTMPIIDLAVLAASGGDALAANRLLEHVGLERVGARIASLGLTRTALMDGFRDRRGPDDAPHLAVGTAREQARLMTGLVSGEVVSPAVSAQVAEWLTLNHDLSLVGAATGLDPFAHDDNAYGLLFLNKTGRDRGIRSEAGVLAGPRAGVAYSLLVCFDDLSIMHRLRAHDVFRVLGVDLMEYTH